MLVFFVNPYLELIASVNHQRFRQSILETIKTCEGNVSICKVMAFISPC